MNILYLCEEYPPGKNGGIGTVVQLLGRALVKQGHNVFVIGLYPHGYNQQSYQEDNGVKIWRLRYKTDIGFIKNKFTLTDVLWLKFLKYTTILHWDNNFSSNALFNFVKKIIVQHDIDIIEMPDWNSFLHNSLTAVNIPLFKIPLIVKLHGSYSYFQNETGKPIKKTIFNAEKKLLQRADAVSSVSSYTSNQTKKIFNYTEAITVLYNGINIISENNLHQSGDKIIFTGSLVKRKGIYSLLKAWNIVCRQKPGLTLHLYGKGPIDDLKRLIEKDVMPSVIFHGHATREVVLNELTTAAIAVFPSYSECFSMAPLEAMAAGCAVIYTEKSSGRELITHKKNGLLIDPDDIDAIANAIILLISNEDMRIAIAKSGYNLVAEKFNIMHITGQHVDFYKKVIKNFTIK